MTRVTYATAETAENALDRTEQPTVPDPAQGNSTGLWALIALLGIATLGVMALSYLQPISADDYGNALRISQTHGFLDHVKSYYLTWTGRATGISIIRFGLGYRGPFAVANGLAFTALAYLTVLLGLGRRPRLSRRDVLLVAIVFAAYWFAVPAISETVFWVTGTATYLWSALLMVLFAAPYRLWLETHARPSALKRVLLGLGLVGLGAACGMTHELVVAALVLLLGVFGTRAWREGRLRGIPLDLWAGAVSLLVGAALMLASPGNGARAQSGAAQGTLLGDLMAFVTYVGKTFGSYLPHLYPWLLLLLMASVPIGVLAAKTQPRLAIGACAAWVASGIATVVPFVLQPQIGLLAGARTNFYAAVLFTIGAVSLFAPDTCERVLDALPPRLTVAVVGVLLCIVIVEIAGSMQVARSIDAQVREREALIAQSIAQGDRSIAVPPLAQKPYRTVYYVDVRTDANDWLNQGVARYYGLDAIRLAP